MASSLPHNPSPARLHRQARELQQRCRRADPAATALLERHHPSPGPVAAQGFPLHACQLVVARGYGFPSWPALQRYLGQAAELGRLSPADDALTDDADRFCALVCLTYDHRDSQVRREAGRQLLADRPELVRSSLHAAAAAGDVRVVAELLDGGADVTALGGPLRRTPLEHLAYSRSGTGDPVATARLLVEAGADVDAGFLWGGLATPFTVLTGVLGEGEMGSAREPAHPQQTELATLLLDAGAEPNDAQGLYNRMFSPSDDHLELLFRYGLGTGDGGPWRRLLGAATESVAEMMQRQVDWALSHRLPHRLDLLAQHGFGPGSAALDDAAPISSNGPGRTPLHDAAWCGDLDRIRELVAAGADLHAVDAEHGTTPLVWAEVGEQDEAAALLRELGGTAGS